MHQRYIPNSRATYLLLILLLIPAATHAQDIVKKFGSNSGYTEVRGVVSDGQNNVIITGTYSSEELELAEGQAIQNRGITDVFLAKYAPDGTLLWSESFGGLKEDYVKDICIDEEGNIYITGNFRSNTLYIGETEVTSDWPDNAYAAKFDNEGNYQWLIHSEKNTSYLQSTGITCSPGNEIIFTGFTTGDAMSFDKVDLTTDNGWYKGYYCRVNTSGEVFGAGFIEDESGGPIEEADQHRIHDVAVDHSGNLYFGGTKSFKLDEPDPNTWSDFRDALYIRKTGPAGDIIWEYQDTAFYQSKKLLYKKDSLFVLGNREEYRTIFNGGTIDTTSKIFYGMLDLQGNKLWGESITGALAHDACYGNGNLFVAAGLLKDEIQLSSFTLVRNSDSSSICPIYHDIFYLEFSKSGDIEYVKNFPGSLEDIPTSIWYSDEGDLLFSGTFESYELNILGQRIVNTSELTRFDHVSGTYWNRAIFSFYARDKQYGDPNSNRPVPENAFMIYPNPSDGMLWLDSAGAAGGLAGKYQLEVCDIHGRVQHREQVYVEQAPHPVNLTSLPPGVYMVTLSSRAGKVSNSMAVIQ